MSKLKLLPNDTAPAKLLEVLGSHATRTGKASGPAVEKRGAKPFHDVLGALTETARNADRTGTPVAVAVAKQHGLHAGAQADDPLVDDRDQGDHGASETEQQPSASPGTSSPPDPLKALMLALNARDVAIRGTADESAADAADRDGSSRQAAGGEQTGEAAAASADAGRRGVHKVAEAVAAVGADRRFPDSASSGGGSVAMPTEAITSAALPSDAAGAAKAFSDLRPSQPPKVEVIGQQTHFAPVLDTLQQVSSAIQADLASPVDQTSSIVAAGAPAGAAGAGLQAVRILTIRLDPPDLGEVTVRMRLKGDNLELNLTATQHDTTQMLQENREVLHDLIRDSGYVPDIVNVQQANLDSSSMAGANQQGAHSQAQPDSSYRPAGDSSGQGGRDQAAAEGNRQGRQQWTRQAPWGAGSHEAARDAGSGIYL